MNSTPESVTKPQRDANGNFIDEHAQKQLINLPPDHPLFNVRISDIISYNLPYIEIDFLTKVYNNPESIINPYTESSEPTNCIVFEIVDKQGNKHTYTHNLIHFVRNIKFLYESYKFYIRADKTDSPFVRQLRLVEIQQMEKMRDENMMKKNYKFQKMKLDDPINAELRKMIFECADPESAVTVIDARTFRCVQEEYEQNEYKNVTGEYDRLCDMFDQKENDERNLIIGTWEQKHNALKAIASAKKKVITHPHLIKRYSDIKSGTQT